MAQVNAQAKMLSLLNHRGFVKGGLLGNRRRLRPSKKTKLPLPTLTQPNQGPTLLSAKMASVQSEAKIWFKTTLVSKESRWFKASPVTRGQKALGQACSEVGKKQSTISFMEILNFKSICRISVAWWVAVLMNLSVLKSLLYRMLQTSILQSNWLLFVSSISHNIQFTNWWIIWNCNGKHLFS